QIGARIALDIQLDVRLVARELLLHVADVFGRDVPPVSARMHRDAVNAGVETHPDGVRHAGEMAAPGVPQCRDFVDVHRKTNHPSVVLTTSTISWAQPRISSWFFPSSITRSSGS